MKRIFFIWLACSFTCMGGLIAQSTIHSITGWNRNEVGGRVLFTPRTIFKTGFSYEIMALSPASNTDLGSWLVKKGAEELVADGYTLPDVTHTQNKEVYSFTTWTVEADKGPRQWFVDYIAFQRSDGAIRYARMIFPKGIKSPYLSTAIQHFAKLSKAEGNQIGPDKNTARRESKNIKTTKRRAPATPLTKAGMGLKDADIKGVVMNTEYGSGVGGMLVVDYRAYLLLKDGSVYKYPDCSPYDLDVAESRKIQPDKWGTWILDGDALIVKLPEKGTLKTERWKKSSWYWTRPAKDAEKISGSFKTISGGGNTAMGGSVMVVSSANISLNDKGQFTYSAMGGGSASESGTSVSAYSNKSSAGTYYLKGYCIELKFNNGEVQRKLFYFYPDTNDTFTINGSDYVPADK